MFIENALMAAWVFGESGTAAVRLGREKWRREGKELGTRESGQTLTYTRAHKPHKTGFTTLRNAVIQAIEHVQTIKVTLKLRQRRSHTDQHILRSAFF